MSSNKRLLHDTLIDAPIDVVWSALREPDQIAQWFGWDYEGLADEIDQYFIAGTEVDQQNHSLRLGSGDEMVLKADGERTRMMTYRPLPDSDPMVEMAADIDEGWVAFVEQLRFLVSRHPGETRATVYVSGAARETYTSLAEALGFPPLGQVGSRYSATVATGENLEGEIWSRQDNVTCLTVESYGDGLIALTDHDAVRHAPHGGGIVVITTYDLTDQRVAELKKMWANLWAEKYEPDAQFGAEQPE